MLNTYFFYALLFAVVGVPFYFHYRIQNLGNQKPEISFINSLSGKLSAFLLVALYLMSFITVNSRKDSHLKIGYCACVLSFFLLFSFRSKVIHQIREIKVDSKEKFIKSFRTLFSFVLLYGIYFSVVEFLIPRTGTLPAVAVAMIFITYSTPLFVRIWMPTQKMFPSEMKDEIKQIFANANNPVSEVYLINTDRFKTYNALVCGPKYGVGPFKRSAFITRNLFEVLEPEEIKAVICHEAAHFKLHHIFKRGLMSLLGIGISVVTVFLPVAFISILTSANSSTQMGLMYLSGLATVFVQFSFIFRVIRKQEFEADLEALNLGATPAAMSSALEKVTIQNGASRKKEDWFSRFMFGSGHPSLEERIQAIVERKLPENSKIIPAWKYTVSYASFVVALGTLTAFTYTPKSKTNREVASVNEATTGQILPTPNNKVEAIESATEE